jgi:hypothetical protein
MLFRAIRPPALVVFGLVWLPCLVSAQQTSTTRPEVGIQEHRSRTVAITGATVFTDPGRSIENAVVVIRDGKISDVGFGLTIPPEARIIELKGKTIYPGFVDLGIEADLPAIDAARGSPHWNSEITPQRSAAESMAANEAIMSKLRKAGVATALIAPKDGIIKGTSALFLTSNEAPSEALLKENVGLHVRLTVARGRGRDSYPSSPMGAVALARQSFFDAQWYAQAWQTYRSQSGIEKPESNDALDALSKHVGNGKLVVFDALNEQYALRADDFGREFGLQVVLRGSGQEYQLLDRPKTAQRRNSRSCPRYGTRRADALGTRTRKSISIAPSRRQNRFDFEWSVGSFRAHTAGPKSNRTRAR